VVLGDLWWTSISSWGSGGGVVDEEGVEDFLVEGLSLRRGGRMWRFAARPWRMALARDGVLALFGHLVRTCGVAPVASIWRLGGHGVR